MSNRPIPRASALFRASVAALVLTSVALILLIACPAVRAQTPGGVFNVGTGTNDFVYHFIVQTDGRILIGGRFTTYNGVARSGVARLLADGTLDPSFDPGSGTVGSVYSIVEQANGQILLAGDFTSYNGVARSGIARVNADGTLDAAFDPGTGADGQRRLHGGGPDRRQVDRRRSVHDVRRHGACGRRAAQPGRLARRDLRSRRRRHRQQRQRH